MERTERLLRDAFDETKRRELTLAVRDAYASAIEAHNPEVGHDSMSFGLLVYKSKVFFLAELAARYDWMQVEQKSPYFRFKIANYFMSSYCAGHTAEADAEVSFPGNRTRAGKLAQVNASQLRLFDSDVQYDDSHCVELVLNDIGNADDGLLNLFIGVPVERDEDGRITKWGTVFHVWSSADSQGGITPMPSAPVENVTPFRPTLKNPVRDEDSGKQ